MISRKRRVSSKPHTRPAPPKRSRAAVPSDGETEKRILEAARQVFIRRGTEGARMQEIAREAGVNQALLHYYFRSKERLAAAVFQMIAGEVLPALIDTLGSELPLAEKADRVIALYLQNLTLNPFLAGYIISELHHHPERMAQMFTATIGAEPARVVPLVIEKVRGQIDDAVAAGTMRAMTPEQFVVNLVSLCVFPFAARPMLAALVGLDTKAFPRFIERHKTDLPAFFHNALRP